MALTLSHSYTHKSKSPILFIVKTRQDDSYNMNSELNLKLCTATSKVRGILLNIVA